MYTIEFQKRGLPHAHILLWLDSDSKLDVPEKINRVISAEFPDPNRHEKLFNVVSTYMVHGPCGVFRSSAPCTVRGKCSKYFPRKFVPSTHIGEDGFAVYRRRDSGISVTRNGVELDNRYVVPYCGALLMRYQAHINVELCNKSNCIKYLFKYINKGPDRITAIVSTSDGNHKFEGTNIDEIKQYYDCRYLSPCESLWRIFAFDIHHRWPSVQRLMFHLPGEQLVCFKDDDPIDEVMFCNKEKITMFMAWFESNKKNSSGRQQTYTEYPAAFVYHSDICEWQARKKGFSLGRLSFIPFGSGEIYYMRLLLNHVTGCTSFEDIRTVNGIQYETYRDACTAMGLVSEDKEFVDCIVESYEFASGHGLRKLFVIMLLSESMSHPGEVFLKTWKYLADGLVYDRNRLLSRSDVSIDDDLLKRMVLSELQLLLRQHGKCLSQYSGIPYHDYCENGITQNVLIMNELCYQKEEMLKEHDILFGKMNAEQTLIYDEVTEAVKVGDGGFYFVYGYGGTGKTFVWKVLSY